MAVVTGFSRTGVIDGVLEYSPADYVRRPLVPAVDNRTTGPILSS
jgi:hypothetical protein